MLCKTLGSVSYLVGVTLGVPEIAMEREEAQDIADPAARLLAKSKYTKQLARKVANGGDVVDLLFASALYGLRIYPLVYVKLVESRPAHAQRTRHSRPVSQPAPNPAASAGLDSGPSGPSGPVVAFPGTNVAGGISAYDLPGYLSEPLEARAFGDATSSLYPGA